MMNKFEVSKTEKLNKQGGKIPMKSFQIHYERK